MKDDLTIISLGAGVQSSVMALMAAKGQIEPMPDGAIFADTQWEPQSIYNHLDWLESELPFPVYRVTAGNLREDVINGTSRGKEYSEVMNTIPAYTSEGMQVNRFCTKIYKLDPITKKIRELLGYRKGYPVKYGTKVSQWIGISVDESLRVKDNRLHYATNRYPLIEMGLSRADCYRWFALFYPDRELQKSACIGCPYHSTDTWLDMKHNRPDEFEDACEFDDKLRTGRQRMRTGGELFLHQERVPLRDATFQRTIKRQSAGGTLGLFSNQFINECEGMCGV